MPIKLYVENSDFHAMTSNLEELFGQSRMIESANSINDPDTEYSRGFGFVKMFSKGDGTATIAALNSKAINGRLIDKEARERENDVGGRDNRW